MLKKALSQKSGIAVGISRPVKPCSSHSSLDKAGDKRGGVGQGLDPSGKIDADSLWHCDKWIRCFIPATGLHFSHIITKHMQPELCTVPVQAAIALDHFGTDMVVVIVDHAQPVLVAQTAGLGMLRQTMSAIIYPIGGERMLPGSGIVSAIISGMVASDKPVGC